MNDDDFQKLVVEKLMNIESRISKIEVKSGLWGALTGALVSIASLLANWMVK